MKKLVKYLRKEDGVTSIEYALIAAGIAIAIIAVVGLLGDQVATTFQQIVDALSGA